MQARSTSSNRGMMVIVLERELGVRAVRHLSPGFAVEVGECALLRDGRIVCGDSQPSASALQTLAALGLCDGPRVPAAPRPGDLVYPMAPHTGRTLLNLVSIVSARQHLLNAALGVRGGFRVARPLMQDLLDHPPADIPAFLQALYGRDAECRGFRFDLDSVILTGFRRAPRDESHVHRQLADRIIDAALTLGWAKPFTRNVRNRKYAMRTWLNALGMRGPEFEEARRVLLGRLPGRGDVRSLSGGGGGGHA